MVLRPRGDGKEGRVAGCFFVLALLYNDSSLRNSRALDEGKNRA